MSALLVLCCFLWQDLPARELVERLGSSDPGVREQAFARLKAIGRPAVPELEKGAKSDDLETARASRLLLKVIPLMERLGPVAVLIPGLENRLLGAAPAAWTREFLEACGGVSDEVPLDGFMPEAFQGAAGEDEIHQVLWRATSRKLKGGAAEGRKLLAHAKSDIRKWAVMYLGAIEDRGAGPAILKLLGDPDSGVRDRAAGAVGALDLREAVPALKKLLEDPDTEVARAAAGSLGRFGSREGIPVLVRHFTSPNAAVRHNALLTLQELKAVEALAQIRPMVKDPEGSVRQAAFDALQGLDPGGFPEDLARILKEPGPHRWAAANYLAKLGRKESIPVLVEYLEDPAPMVRQKALGVLAFLRARDELLEFLKRAQVRDEGLRDEAARALGSWGEREALPRILKGLKEGDHGACFGWLSALEGAAGPAEAVAVADHLDACRNMESWSRARAILSRWGVAGCVGPLRKAAGSPEEWTRLRSLEILASLDVPDLAGLFEEMLKDPNGSIRSVAAAALGVHGTRASMAALLPLLKDPERDVRETAARSLGGLGAEEAVEPLGVVLKEGGGHEAAASAVALGRIGGARAEALLIERSVLNDDAWISAWVASSLARLGRREGVERLLENARNGLTHGIRAEMGRLDGLNALRRPEAWKALGERRVARSVTGTTKEILETLAKNAGLRLEIEGDLPAWLLEPARLRVPPGGARLRDCLETSLSWPGCLLPKYRFSMALPEMPPPDLTFILDGDRLRVLTTEAAVPFWGKWREGR